MNPKSAKAMSAPVTLRTCNARNRTGCHGVSFCIRTIKRRGGIVVRRYFNAYTGPGKNRSFRIDTLGEAEAFRRAVELRAAFERRTLCNR